MHFFLNKIGYLPEHGFITPPDYIRLPFFVALRAAQRAHHTTTDANRIMFLGRTRWLPNMAAAQMQIAELPRLERLPEIH